MIVRSYQPSDKTRLIEIFNLNTPVYFDPAEVQDYSRYLDLYNDTYFAIEQDDILVGGVGYIIKEDKRSASITWIFFHPDYTNQGFGKHAVEFCLKLFKSMPEIERLTVRTSQFAYLFFEKFGYKLIHSERNYWGPGLDLYLMEMPNNYTDKQ